jgi:hypothetical protein
MMSKPIKIILATLATFFILYFGVSLLIAYLTTGNIIVSTNGRNDISVLGQGPSSPAPHSSTGKSKLSIKLHDGTYVVTVSNRSFSSQKVIQIKAHQTLRVTVNLQSIGQVEPVTTAEVYDLMATANSLTYIDQNGNSLVNVNNQNQALTLLPSVSFNSINWANPSLGVAQDESSNLYSVEGLVANKLSLPITPSINNYAITPSGFVYFSNGKILYAGSINGNYKQILKSSNTISILKASNSGVVINVSDTAKSSGEKSGGSLELITPQGKTYSGDIDVDEAAWSPNGLDLVVTGDSGTFVYSNQLHLLYSLPKSNVDSIVWLNNDTILYGVASNLWSYNIQSQSTNVLADVIDFGSVSGIYPSQDGSYIYISIEAQPTNNIYLTRLGLNNQPVSALMQQLQVFLPNIYEGCSLGYLNFTSPTITVQGTDSSSENCIAVAQSYLQTYTINTSNLYFVTEN